MKSSIPKIAFIVVACFGVAVAFQNCGSPEASSEAASRAAACIQHSSLRDFYPSGISRSMPQGVTSGIYDCVNPTSYNTFSFNASTQVITLSQGSSSKSYNLSVGSAGCGSSASGSGDTFLTADQSSSLDIRVGSSSIFISGEGISCDVAR